MYSKNLCIPILEIRATHTLAERKAIVKRFNGSNDRISVLMTPPRTNRRVSSNTTKNLIKVEVMKMKLIRSIQAKNALPIAPILRPNSILTWASLMRESQIFKPFDTYIEAFERFSGRIQYHDMHSSTVRTENRRSL